MTKRKTPAAPEKRIAPDDKTLQQLAEMPEDVKKMMLGYGYGLMTGRKLAASPSA